MGIKGKAKFVDFYSAIFHKQISNINPHTLMRSGEEIKKLIIDKAIADNRIRAVLLNGSRANSKIKPDKYQDFDIVYIVQELDSFIKDHHWANIFGDKIIEQLPDEMTFGKPTIVDEEPFRFTYLMLFQDGNRVDLTLFAKNKIETDFNYDSLTIVWLDKDNLFLNCKEANDSDYLVKKPTEKEFLDTCNEFWWVSTYVSKGLLRNEITYSKEMLEMVVRPMFMKLVEWFVGTETGFSVSFGKGGKWMKNYLSPALYNKILSTYSNHEVENNWKALFTMTELFGELSSVVAQKLHFQYNAEEEKNVKKYLQQSHQGKE